MAAIVGVTNDGLICPMPCPKPGSAGTRRLSGEQLLQGIDRPSCDESPPLTARESGLVAYTTDIRAPLSGSPLRSGEVLYLTPEGEETCSFVKASLTLHCKGIVIEPAGSNKISSKVSIAWTPFTLVQACRLHSIKADNQLYNLRLFKLSIFQHGITVFFATHGDSSDMDRTRWVADISRGIRTLTKSLFPATPVTTEPLANAAWTGTRLIAGYLLMCDDHGISCVYSELHCNHEFSAAFACYDHHDCQKQLLRLGLDMHTSVSERVGIDCGCFNFDGYNFCARTCHEKCLWLRAISNVKVKLRHQAPNPSVDELRCYRQEIQESLDVLEAQHQENDVPDEPMLPVRTKATRIGAAGLAVGPVGNITGPAILPAGPVGMNIAPASRFETHNKKTFMVPEEPPLKPSFPRSGAPVMLNFTGPAALQSPSRTGPPNAKVAPRPALAVSSPPSEMKEYEDVTFVSNDANPRAKESTAPSETIVPPLTSLKALLGAGAVGVAALELQERKSSRGTTATGGTGGTGAFSSREEEKQQLQAAVSPSSLQAYSEVAKELRTPRPLESYTPRAFDLSALQTPRLGKCDLPLGLVKQSSKLDLAIVEGVYNNCPPLPEPPPERTAWETLEAQPAEANAKKSAAIHGL